LLKGPGQNLIHRVTWARDRASYVGNDPIKRQHRRKGKHWGHEQGSYTRAQCTTEAVLTQRLGLLGSARNENRTTLCKNEIRDWKGGQFDL